MTTTFGATLAALRTARNYNQTQVGRSAGLDHSTVNRLETGSRKHPTRETVERLAIALDLSPVERDRLFIAAGYMPLTPPTSNPTGLARIPWSPPEHRELLTRFWRFSDEEVEQPPQRDALRQAIDAVLSRRNVEAA